MPYQSTHNTGGAIMGTDPKTSVVNKYCRAGTCRTCSSSALSVSAEAGYNPTGTVGALAYHTADAVVNKYVKKPGPLVRRALAARDRNPAELLTTTLLPLVNFTMITLF